MEKFKTGFTAVGFSCERGNFRTGDVSLRAAQDFIQTIVARENARNQQVSRFAIHFMKKLTCPLYGSGVFYTFFSYT